MLNQIYTLHIIAEERLLKRFGLTTKQRRHRPRLKARLRSLLVLSPVDDLRLSSGLAMSPELDLPATSVPPPPPLPPLVLCARASGTLALNTGSS